MSQQDTLRALDSLITAELISAGMGDTASYTPPSGAAITGLSVLKDHAFVNFGDDGAPVGGQETVITFFLSELPAPVRGGTVTIGSRSWKLVRETARDDSMTQWVVQ